MNSSPTSCGHTLGIVKSAGRQPMPELHAAERAWRKAGYDRLGQTGTTFVPGTFPPREADPEGRFAKGWPILSDKEAISAAKRLWTKFAGKPWAGKVRITTGRRYTWPRRGVLVINAGRGWWNLIHDLSHAIDHRLNPSTRPHDRRQEDLEGQMVAYALDKGWLDGSLKREPKAKAQAEAAKPSVVERRASRVFAAFNRAQARLKLAQAAIKRLRPRVMRYERAIGDTAALAALGRKPAVERKPRRKVRRKAKPIRFKL